MTNEANFSLPKISENREDQSLADPKMMNKLGKRKIFSDANYPYKKNLLYLKI